MARVWLGMVLTPHCPSQLSELGQLPHLLAFSSLITPWGPRGCVLVVLGLDWAPLGTSEMSVAGSVCIWQALCGAHQTVS